MLTLTWGIRGDASGLGVVVSGIGIETAGGTGECFLVLSCCHGFAWSLLNLSLKAFNAICLQIIIKYNLKYYYLKNNL